LRLTDDSGNNISIDIHDSLSVPSAPMCLLSLQTIAQQTPNPIDRFHAKGIYGIITFSGHHKTIFYNSKNNLPIFFTSIELTYQLPIDNMVTSYLSTETMDLQIT
jgi:hypothetical protein